MILVGVVVVSALVIAGVHALRTGERRQAHAHLVTYRLRFPRDLDADAVEAALSGLGGLLLPWWRRWFSPVVVGVEVAATAEGVEHFITAPESWAAAVENLLQAHLPAVGYKRTAGALPTVDVAVEYTVTSGTRALDVNPVRDSAALLASLQPLKGDQALRVQWLVTPHGPLPAPIAPPTPVGRNRRRIADELSALRHKRASTQLLAVARIGATAKTNKRARHLIRRVEVSWHVTRAPGVHLKRRSLPEAWAAARLNGRAIPTSAWPLILGAHELAGLVGWPVGAVQVPGLSLGGHRQLVAGRLVPRTGTLLGNSTFPGDERPVSVDIEGRLRHMQIVGPTGTGKSTLLANLIAQDIAAGHGVVVVDPKGDLVSDVTELIGPDRRNDVIVLDPADEDYPVGLNPLRSAGATDETTVENLVGLFRSLYRSSWGPRTDDIFRATLQTLVRTEGATLCEVLLLLTDPGYRRRLVGSIDDPVGLESFWGWYESLSDAERLNVIGPVLNKVRAWTMRQRVRSVIGQARPKLDFADAIRRRKVVLVNLASGLLGTEAADLLGALVVAELWHATAARAALPPEKRHPVMAYIDEAQRVMHLPTATSDLLEMARGYGLSLTIAHQHLGQLPPEMREAVVNNCRSRIVFQLGAGDARSLASDFGSSITPDDLEGLGPYEIVAQVFAAGHRQPPFTARALPPAKPNGHGAAVRAASRERYGIARDELEQALRQRHAGAARTPGSVGSRRRTRPEDAS